MGYLLATLKPRRARPTEAIVALGTTCLLMLGSASAFCASLDNQVETIDVQVEASKLVRYEQRIKRLENTIQSLRSEIELLSAQRDGLEVHASTLYKSLQSLVEKHAGIAQQLPDDGDIDYQARQRHADFEVYLAERKYNRALNALQETQHQMSRTTDYLQDRINLLERNRQGVVWQKQVLKRYHKAPSTEPRQQEHVERLAQAR